ncbi:MAG: hypothetical protein ABEH86_09595 [Haloarcula sp.]
MTWLFLLALVVVLHLFSKRHGKAEVTGMVQTVPNRQTAVNRRIPGLSRRIDSFIGPTL